MRYFQGFVSPFIAKLSILQINKARNFLPIETDTTPDTYVKCYIKDGERLKYKKKTRVVRHSLEPNYKQCLKYQVWKA